VKELNNPAPLWWLKLWLLCIIFANGYWFVYPAWPTFSNYTAGYFGWSQYGQLKHEQGEITELRAKYEDKFAAADLPTILKDSQLYNYGRAGGGIAFKNNCAACHGQGAQGGHGYPNLNDDDWIWGGRIENIYRTIQYGVNNGHPETRVNQMQAWGRDGLLTNEQIAQVSEYVLKMHAGDKAEVTPAYTKGKEIFAQNCVACHGEQGQGNQEMGAPRLNDNIWLYGGDIETIKTTIYGGRAGVMPVWAERLDDSTIKKLATYVHSLGGGQ
jgi:cytochrome c oxidase cbb3-type subunit 3